MTKHTEQKMKEEFKRICVSDRFVIILGLVILPILSFILITLSDESPLYTSISRLAWINGRWFVTFLWALTVMVSTIFLTYRMVKEGPLREGAKRIFFIFQTVNVVLAFIGCIIFPAKDGTELMRLVNYLHDYLTIGAWALYGIGLLAYSVLIYKKDDFLGFLGVGLMSFIILSSLFFVIRVIDPSTYVGASAVSEVYVINNIFIYLTVMYVAERLKKRSITDRAEGSVT